MGTTMSPPPTSLFSVSIAHAQVLHRHSSCPPMSNIHILPSRCQPPLVRRHKARGTHKHSSTSNKLKLLALALFGALNPYSVYAIPGTNNVLVHGRSLDATSQQRMAATSVPAQQSPAEPPQYPLGDSKSTEDMSTLRNLPHCFVADTDSFEVLVDTGANRFIVNNPRLLRNFKAERGAGIKGVGGSPVAILGSGTFTIKMKVTGTPKIVELDVPAVYVPSSPFNLAPPQLLRQELKGAGYQPNDFTLGDKEYTISFKDPSTGNNLSLIAPLDARDLFTFRTAPGYSSFCGQASRYDRSWEAFPGFVHSTTGGPDLDPSVAEVSRESVAPDQMREPAQDLNGPVVSDDGRKRRDGNRRRCPQL